MLLLRRRSLFAACCAAAVLITCGLAAATASAQTVRGRILGEPAVSGAHAQVPLALTGGGVAVLTVPARSGFRTVSTGRTSAERTRLGDLVSARVRSLVHGRARAAYVKIVARSQAPAFATLRALLGGAQTGARAASAAVATIAQQEAAGNGTVRDPDALRNAMLAFRATLNDLVNGLRDQATNMDKVRGSVSASKALVRQLDDTAAAARTAARKLDAGVTGLDEFINSIGGLSADGLPVGSVSEVSQVLAAARSARQHRRQRRHRHAAQRVRRAMKLATFLLPDGVDPLAGEVRGDAVVAFADGSTVLDRLASGDRSAAEGESYTLADVTLLAPVPRPRAIFGVGLNYAAHAAETGATPPEAPMIFMKLPLSAAAPNGSVAVPAAAMARLDYEGELAVVIGAGGEIAGYAVADDLSARHLQKREKQWTRAKGFDNSAPYGPWITTADEVADPGALRVQTWVNDELRQDSSTSDLIFGVEAIVAFLRETCTLEPGDLILTGTPSGVGQAMDPPRFLASGDRVRIAIEALGEIEHTIA